MKLLLFITLLVCYNSEFVTKYQLGTYITSCSGFEIDGNKLCASATYEGSFQRLYKNWNCIIFDECSYIENNNGILIDKQIPNCNTNTNNKISILEKKIDLIIKYINLQQDMKYKGLEDFFL
jgi:hypothetical protein